MSRDYVLAALTVLAAIGAGVLGLCAHLCWLALCRPRELFELACMFARVVTG